MVKGRLYGYLVIGSMSLMLAGIVTSSINCATNQQKSTSLSEDDKRIQEEAKAVQEERDAQDSRMEEEDRGRSARIEEESREEARRMEEETTRKADEERAMVQEEESRLQEEAHMAQAERDAIDQRIMEEEAEQEESRAAGVEHTVERGENLWRISSYGETYDNPFMWPLIYKENVDQINDPDLIYPGQVLNIDKDFSGSDSEDAIRHAKTRGPWSLNDGADRYWE